MADLLTKFQSLGLSEQKAKETLKNANVTKNLEAALGYVQNGSLAEGVGMLIYHMGTKIKPQAAHHMPILVEYIVSKKLDNTMRVDAALEYLLKNAQKQTAQLNIKEFEGECGVGIVVSPEEIERVVQEEIQKNKEALIEQRYHFNSFKILQEVRNKLKWADAKNVKSAIDVEIFDLLGPKTEQDLKPLAKGDKKKDKTKEIQKGKTQVSKILKSTITPLQKLLQPQSRLIRKKILVMEQTQSRN